MAEEKKEEIKQVEEEKEKDNYLFDYEHASSFKLSDKFKARFGQNIKGKFALTTEGLTAIAHVKGLKSLKTKIIQYPDQNNGNMCICECTLIGYDRSPITHKVEEVEYSDIGDASPANCNKMVAPSFIRMASTRATGRALRKYLNIDMACAEELTDDDITQEGFDKANVQLITMEQLNQIKELVMTKKLTQQTFNGIMERVFHMEDYNNLSQEQGNQLIQLLTDYIPTNQ